MNQLRRIIWSSSASQSVKALVACAAIAVSAIWMFSSFRARPVQLPVTDQEFIGERAATETARLLSGGGAVVVVGPDMNLHYDLLMEAQVKGFQKTVKKQGKISILASEQLHLTPRQRATGLTAEMYFDLLAKYPSANGIVSFIGVGEFANSDLQRVPTQRPMLVSVSLNAFPPRRLFQSEIVQLAIGPRPDQSAPGGKPKSQAEWFEQNYRVATADNLPE